jgi:CheY-specific phosphatase CheX
MKTTMKKAFDEILWRVAEEVMGKLAFMFSFPQTEGNEDDNNRPSIFATVSFKGPFEGKLIMAVASVLLPQLAGNMLGLEQETDSSPEEQRDALKELINVVCGNLLPELAGKQAIFKVGVPEILEGLGPEQEPPLSAVKMMVEDEPCEIRLYITGEVDLAGISSEDF